MLRSRLLGLLLLVPSLLAAAEVDAVGRNAVAYYTAKEADRGAPAVASALAALEAEATSVSRNGFLLFDGRWSDIDYAQIPDGGWSPWEHFRRVMTLARAYATPGQRLYHDAALRTKIEVAVAYIPTFYGPTIKAQGNWWFWTIGPALDLGPALVLLESDLDPAVLAVAIDTLRARIGPYPGMTSTGSLLDGQNLVWSAMNHLMLAILQSDDQRAVSVRDRMASTVRITSGEGIRSDLSFQQHGPQLYTGGYGSSFAYDVSRYQLFTSGTAFALPPASGTLFADFLVEGIARSLYHNYFDPSVIGREVTKPWTSGWNGLAALLHGSGNAGSPRREEVAAAAARMLQTWPGGLSPELAALALSIGASAPRWPEGTRVYWDSDLAISRRSGWYASVRMNSTRTQTGENTNGEAILGSRQSDGRLYLAIDGDEYWNGAWPAMDWSRLPGITVEQRPNAASSYYGTGRRPFAGGTADGDRGVAAMELAPFDSMLEARKSWIFFHDSIVFLTSGIRAASSYPVETVVEQRPLRGPYPLVVDGVPASAATGAVARWAAAEKIGYYFPTEQGVRFANASRTGSWSDLGSAASGEVTRQILTILIDHGAAPADAAAAYVIVPGVTAGAMQQWAAAAPVEILANDATVAAACDRRDGAVGAAFWRAGAIAGIAVDRPAVVFRSGDPRAMTLSVADPARGSSTVRVIVDGGWRVATSDRRAVASSPARGKTAIDIELSGGRTTNVTLESTARRRVVRR